MGSRISAAYLPDGRFRTPLYRISGTDGGGVGAGAGTECLDLRISGALVCISRERRGEGKEKGLSRKSDRVMAAVWIWFLLHCDIQL